MKIFLDANVLFSASLSDTGTAQALLIAARSAGAHCVGSERAFSEAQRNLSAKSPQSLPNLELIAALVSRVAEPAAAHIDAARAVGVVDKDLPLLAAAIACHADWFVTDDARHFGHLFGERVEGVLVLSLRAAVEALNAKPPSRSARAK